MQIIIDIKEHSGGLVGVEITQPEGDISEKEKLYAQVLMMGLEQACKALAERPGVRMFRDEGKEQKN